jgi:hypothetical protein
MVSMKKEEALVSRHDTCGMSGNWSSIATLTGRTTTNINNNNFHGKNLKGGWFKCNVDAGFLMI